MNEQHIEIQPHASGGYVVDGKLRVKSDGQVFRLGYEGAGQALRNGGVEAAKSLIRSGKV